MKNWEKKCQRGSIILETSIVLPLFILAIVFIYCIFMIVYAQNAITHALIQSVDSFALDAYLNNHVESVSDADTVYNNLGDLLADTYRLGQDEHFCYTAEIVTGPAAKKRFIGYLTGGDDETAKNKLNALGVVNGISGIAFNVVQTDEDITITIDYQLQFLVDFFDMGKIPVTQSVTAKLWL